MNILMMTNTFTPHVGGVARSVEAYVEELRKRGHRVLVVAPVFQDQPKDETGVVRVPAIQHFNGSDFSVVLPVPRILASEIEAFAPAVVHSHHPFLLGATALRVAYRFRLPLVFTHHTMYEQYTHYVPGDSEAIKRFVADISTRYANFCDRVVAPSESIADVLRQRGVKVPLTVIPTGVRLERFRGGDGQRFRAANGIPHNAFLVGHVGRLAPEKNLEFLTQAAVRFLDRRPQAHFLVVGHGSSEASVRDAFAARGLGARLHMPGSLEGEQLVSAYRAMDVFAFASKSETQGMVLTEAMAAGVPVVALDAPGVREVVADERNGRLLDGASTVDAFAGALEWVADESRRRLRLTRGALETAKAFSMVRSADKALALYGSLGVGPFGDRRGDYRLWASVRRLIAAELGLLRGVAEAATDAALQSRHARSQADG